MEVSGWGRFPKTTADIVEPVDSASLKKIILAQKKSDSLICRGAGKSYGDSSLSGRILSSRFLDSFLSLDEDAKTIRCGAGVSLDEILKLCIPRGWFLNVVPGTKFISVGGAIAADVHGKNHHLDGSFCDYVQNFSLMLASGEVVICSEQENPELFHATCGGMGLTGIIVDATIALKKISSTSITQQTLVANNLKQCFELLENNERSKYSVAWLDCLSKGDELGRSLIFLAEHEQESDKKFSYQSRRGPGVPFSTPAFLLNRFTMELFNRTYFGLKKSSKQKSTVGYDGYFFPLDNIGNWNRLYGSKGFLQYQFVIPTAAAFEGISKVLSKVSEAGKGSFLSVLKKLGRQNENLLSFPKEGYTLALDFKREKSLFPLLNELDEIVVDHGGRLYLAKDARMSEAVFKAGYPDREKFMQVKNRVDPSSTFSSLQSDRLGLS